ncbi:MAG: CU044_5270 family protein [Actinomycetota bacterium]
MADELKLLRGIGVEPELADPKSRERARARLMAEIAPPEEAPRPARAPHRRRRWLITVPAVAALVIAALVLSVVLPSRRGGPPATAASELRHLAVVAAGRPGFRIAQGQFAYTKFEGIRSSTFWNDAENGLVEFTVVVPFTREVWRAPDGSGRDLSVTSAAEFFSPKDRGEWRTAGSPPLPEPRESDHEYGPGEFIFIDLSDLPGDPGELLAEIRAGQLSGSEPLGDAATFRVIAELLEEAYVPPELRESLYLAASRLPGVELEGRVLDRAGREGIGLSFTESGIRRTVIFDPETSAELGQEVVELETGLTYESVVILESGLAETRSTRPREA